MVEFVLFVTCVIAVLSVECVHEEIIGTGYNIIYGNPDGVNPVSGGKDPGILKYKILDISDKMYQNFITYNNNDTCKQSVKWFYDGKSYQDKLLDSIESSGDGNFRIHSAAFTLSPQFEYNNGIAEYKVVQDMETICVKEEVKSIMNIMGTKYFSVTETFAAAVCSLNSVYDTTEYRNFLGHWGTHIIVAAAFGTKTIKRYESTDVQFFKYIEEKVPEAIFRHEMKAKKIDFRVFASTPHYKKSYGEHSKTLSVGSSLQCEPVWIKLISIDMLLQKKFWRNLDAFIDHTVCNDNTSIDSIVAKKPLIVRALNEYSGTIKVQGVHDVEFQIIWPRGTYAFVQVQNYKYGAQICPPGVDWNMSGVLWGTGESTEKSLFEHFYDETSFMYLELYFCIKSEISTDKERQRPDWPKGNYCIIKYQDCPNGFSSGSIVWESGATRSYKSQYLPDGFYNRDSLQINFCCRKDGDVSNPINLPGDTPFYFVRNNGSTDCQQVYGMKSREEYIKWGSPNKGALYKSGKKYADGAHPMVHLSESFDITLYFCYYVSK